MLNSPRELKPKGTYLQVAEQPTNANAQPGHVTIGRAYAVSRLDPRDRPSEIERKHVVYE